MERVHVVLAALLGIGAAVAQAQTPTFEGQADVLTVEVPVHAVTKNGEPVADLDLDDFVVMDDGVAQKVTGFRRVELTPAATAGVSAPVRSDDEIPSGARRRLLLLFDLAFSDPFAIARARDAARDLVLEGLHPSDLVGVATYSSDRGVRLLMTFSSDRTQAARAIDTLADPNNLRNRPGIDPLSFLLAPPELDTASGSGDGNDGGPGPGAAGNDGAAENQRIINERFDIADRAFRSSRVTAWSRSLGELAGFLGQVDGRKHVLLFSEGFDGRLLLGRRPSSTGQDSLAEQQAVATGQIFRVDTDRRYGDPKLQGDIAEMMSQFQRADCVLQAVDIEDMGVDDGRSDKGVGRDALFYMANETGGQLFTNTNNLRSQLDRALRSTEVTYLLAFEPTERRGAGEFHRLKVKGPRGTRLFHRSGYVEPENFEDLHPFEKSLLASDAISTLQAQSEIRLSVLAVPFRATAETAYVPVLIEMNGADLLEGEQGSKVAVEIYTYVTDGEGEIRSFFADQVAMDLGENRERFATTGLKYYGQLALGPGRFQLRILVRNARTGATAVQALPLAVPDWADARPTLLAPLFFEAPGSWVMVRQRQPDGIQSESVVYPFTVNGNTYVPAAAPRLTADAEAWLCLVGYDLGSRELMVEGSVRMADGTPVEGGRLELTERTVTGIDGLDKLLAAFRPADLAAGDYTLDVSVVDETAVPIARTSLDFRVEG